MTMSYERMSHASYLRGENHFIRLDGAGWVLIDGPLKDMLDKSNYPEVTFPVLASRDLRFDGWTPDEMANRYVKYTALTFERVEWHPGVYCPRVIYPGTFVQRYDNWQRSRCRFGWRTADGSLPVLEETDGR